MPRKKPEPNKKINKNEAQDKRTVDDPKAKAIEEAYTELEKCVGAFILLDSAMVRGGGDLAKEAGDHMPLVLMSMGDIIRDTRKHVQKALSLTYKML